MSVAKKEIIIIALAIGVQMLFSSHSLNAKELKETKKKNHLKHSKKSNLSAEKISDNSINKEQASRQGFFIGGGLSIGAVVDAIKQVIGGGEFRIGGGFTDRLLLYGESSSMFTRKYGSNIILQSLQAKMQYFLYQNFYSNLGIGLSIARISIPGGEDGSEYESSSVTKAGFALSVGAGYEFRLGKHAALAPEVSFYYERSGGTNFFLIPIATGHFNWYF